LLVHSYVVFTENLHCSTLGKVVLATVDGSLVVVSPGKAHPAAQPVLRRDACVSGLPTVAAWHPAGHCFALSVAAPGGEYLLLFDALLAPLWLSIAGGEKF
jgi:hypothetical protein